MQRSMAIKKLLTLMAVGAAAIALSILPTGTAERAEAASTCTSPHCYSLVSQQAFSPGATEVWGVLTTYCQTLESATKFDTNEIWAVVPGTANYVEFGHAREIPTGSYLTDHWFWARTNGGAQQEFDLSNTFTHGTAYNATIKMNTSTGDWQYYQGGSLLGQGALGYPAGPINRADMGGEMYSINTNTEQNSFSDGSAGRIQSGVSYSGWAASPFAHDVPPYSSSVSWGNTYIRDYNPSVSGVAGC
jgi:hypothetical protein